MAWHKFVARISNVSFRFLKNLTNFLDALFSGFWLGVMGERSLGSADELYYTRNKSYSDDKYNQSGLFDWEKPMIEKHFTGAKSLLLIAAGGGREVLALSKLGFEVESYECNPALIEYGNVLLQKSGIESRIKYLPRNSVPDNIKKYDGIIIGWGAYSHMPGNKKRHSFLTGLYPFLNKETPLMISFLWTRERNKRDKIVKSVSDFFRLFSHRDKTALGDKLEPDFIHYFTEEEIKSELLQAKYRIIDYNATDYGCVVVGI